MRISLFSVQDHYPDQARSVTDLYRNIISQAKLADELGYEAIWVAEHHFHEYGVVPNPAIVLAALAQETRRLRLGSAISILTFHDAKTVAENYAMVDQLSGGRLNLGVGSGYLAHEFSGYGIDLASKRERFEENLSIVKRLLSGERVSFHGKYTSIDEVQLNVLPLQDKIPVYVAISNKDAAKSIGNQGDRMLTMPYSSYGGSEEIGEVFRNYCEGRKASGVPLTESMAPVCLHTHVAETDEQARRNVQEAFDRYVKTRLKAGQRYYDEMLEKRLILCGSVETVTDRILELQKMGIDHILTLQSFGLLPNDLVESSMRRLATEVLPNIQEAKRSNAA